jgi:hypothetical protein
MKKITFLLRSCALLICILLSSYSFSQTSEVIVSVNWPAYSSENTVEIYNPSNGLVGSITDPTGTGDSSYSTTLNLGCLDDLANYYFIMYDTANDGWMVVQIILLLRLAELQ